MEPTLADIDWQLVQMIAIGGVEELALTNPAAARRIRRALELQGGLALNVDRLDDGRCVIYVAFTEVATVPIARLFRGESIN